MRKKINKFPKQFKMAGKLREYDITYQEIGQAVGKTAGAISAIINGHIDFKLSLARKIAAYMSKKAKKEVKFTDFIQ